MLFYGFVFCITCHLSLSLNGLREKAQKLPRYAIDPRVKPAIFGSYCYDMVKGKFITGQQGNSSTTEIDLTDIIFTVNASSHKHTEESFRKHVAITTESLKLFKWRPQRKLNNQKNSTTYVLSNEKNASSLSETKNNLIDDAK